MARKKKGEGNTERWKEFDVNGAGLICEVSDC